MAEEDGFPAAPEGELIREPHDLAVALPGLLPGTDPVAHERDILFVVGLALDSGEVLTHADFERWLDRQKFNVQRSGAMAGPGAKYPDAEAAVVKIARHLRFQQSVFRDRR